MFSRIVDVGPYINFVLCYCCLIYFTSIEFNTLDSFFLGIATESHPWRYWNLRPPDQNPALYSWTTAPLVLPRISVPKASTKLFHISFLFPSSFYIRRFFFIILKTTFLSIWWKMKMYPINDSFTTGGNINLQPSEFPKWTLIYNLYG